MTNQLPARRPNGAVLATSTAMEIEGLNARELGLKHPRLRIGHPDGGYRLGEFKGPSMEVVFLRMNRYRTYQEGDWKSPIVCASADGLVPLETIATPKARTCEICPYGNSSEDPTTHKWIAPVCNEAYAFLGVWPEGQNVPFWLLLDTWSRVKPTREFLDYLNSYNLTARKRGEEYLRGVYELMVTLTTEERRNGGTVWAVPHFAVRRMSAEESAPYREFYQAARDLIHVPEVRGAGETDDIAEEARVAAEAEVVTEPLGGNSTGEVPF